MSDSGPWEVEAAYLFSDESVAVLFTNQKGICVSGDGRRFTLVSPTGTLEQLTPFARSDVQEGLAQALGFQNCYSHGPPTILDYMVRGGYVSAWPGSPPVLLEFDISKEWCRIRENGDIVLTSLDNTSSLLLPSHTMPDFGFILADLPAMVRPGMSISEPRVATVQHIFSVTDPPAYMTSLLDRIFQLRRNLTVTPEHSPLGSGTRVTIALPTPTYLETSSSSLADSSARVRGLELLTKFVASWGKVFSEDLPPRLIWHPLTCVAFDGGLGVPIGVRLCDNTYFRIEGVGTMEETVLHRLPIEVAERTRFSRDVALKPTARVKKVIEIDGGIEAAWTGQESCRSDAAHSTSLQSESGLHCPAGDADKPQSAGTGIGDVPSRQDHAIPAQSCSLSTMPAALGCKGREETGKKDLEAAAAAVIIGEEAYEDRYYYTHALPRSEQALVEAVAMMHKLEVEHKRSVSLRIRRTSNEYPLISHQVVEETTVPDVASFSAYADGRCRARFVDGCLAMLPRDGGTCRVLLPDTACPVQFRPESVPEEWEKYLLPLLEFRTWAFQTPRQRIEAEIKARADEEARRNDVERGQRLLACYDIALGKHEHVPDH
eukprot:Rmarinus@m.9175